jgi:hypothetical protein
LNIVILIKFRFSTDLQALAYVGRLGLTRRLENEERSENVEKIKFILPIFLPRVSSTTRPFVLADVAGLSSQDQLGRRRRTSDQDFSSDEKKYIVKSKLTRGFSKIGCTPTMIFVWAGTLAI